MKNIIKMKFLSVVLITLFSTIFISCDETEDYDVGLTNVSEVSGDWYIQFLVDGVDVYNLGYQLITTTNSSSNTSTEFIIDDREHTWAFKVKCPIDLTTKTFSGESLSSNVDGYEVDVTITNGAIVEDGTVSSGGNTVDSIYFDAVFSDDPTTVYQITGYKRTGLAEDEH
ncbi:hypothetical protein PW52_01155 [Tamlana sedimentorum]|uniref:Lipid-binding hydrolase n=1 Tax=Neotamlana sedimentorum TaxID=1435349 RepID=A0A0D7WDD3_9FLAO|nr:lipid-binding protein [Tamlana sedimentorum]KJD37094.1 hypothetical protein PW52_01155 [Tamlana sedimentorum]